MSTGLVVPARRSRARTWLLRLAVSTLVATALSVGVIGWFHTVSGRAVYARVFGAQCPIGRASAQDVETGRLRVARAVRGTTAARTRPALGFELDRTTRDEIDAWVTQNQLSCRERRERTLLLCVSVPSEALGRRGFVYDEVTFGFTPSTLRLVNLTAVRYRLPHSDAVRFARALEDEMQRAVGAPSRRGGELTTDFLSSAQYATSVTYYSFANYLADITATNIINEGVIVREHYMSAAD
jgi:hypothetical protein